MDHHETCLIASDEEDEDGNLSEAVPVDKSVSVPVREVIYLPEDTTNFKPEEDEETGQQKESRRSIKVKSLDSLRKTEAPSIVTTDIKSKTSVETRNTSSHGKASNKTNTGTLKAADLMPPSIKKCINVVQNNSYKKAKYARQATPICDAIMREYSKRQRVMKQKGSVGSFDISDLPIQELLKKAKLKGAKKNEKDVSSTNAKSKSVSEESLEDKNSDPLIIVKQEIIDVKPEVIYAPAIPVEVKQEKCTSFNSNPLLQSEKSTHNVIKNNYTSRGRGRGRGRGRPSKNMYQKKRKWQISDDDNTDEDPDFDPSVEKVKTKRVTRSSRRAASFNHQHESEDSEVNMHDSHSDELGSKDNVTTIQKDKVINVAERLKSLAEKIADVLTKEPSPNINSEAEKLLHTTQELIEMQKKTLQNSEREAFSAESAMQIKQEIIDKPENEMEISTQSLTEHTITNTSFSSHSSAQQSLNIFNQLQRHEAALQKKLSENISSQDVFNTTKKNTPSNLANTGNLISGPVSVQEKCTFIMDFFTSYQEVFDEYTVKEAIPILSETIMLCVNELTECIQRTKRAETIKSVDHKHQEISLAKQSYLKIIMSSGGKFFPWFNILIDKITKTKTSKALVNTLILYISGSLSVKIPKLKNHVHRLRRVLLFMFKAHDYDHPLVNPILQTPNDVFDGEIKLIRHILKYFQVRKFLPIPTEFVCNYLDDSVEEESQFKTELSIMDTAILKHIDPLVNVDRPAEGRSNQKDIVQLGISSSGKNKSRLSSSTLEFIEALRNERGGDTKRIEQKLDYVLNVLSGSDEGLGSNKNIAQRNLARPKVNSDKGISDIQNFKVTVNLGKRVPNVPTVKLGANAIQQINTAVRMSRVTTGSNQPTSLPGEKSMLLAQLLEDDHAGLDSLFSSYLSSNNEVKSEPVDIAESCNEITDISTQQVFVSIKEEPNNVFVSENETAQPNTSNEQFLSEDAVFNDSFTEEYNFTKAEQDFMDADPFS